MIPPSCRQRFLIFCTLTAAALAIGLRADTYSNWKSRVFSVNEQADPTISDELAPSPAGDGIPNLLKYAFAVDPHLDGTFALPQVAVVNTIDSLTGLPKKYPTITIRVSSTDYPS